VLKRMRSQKSGHIVNIASGGAITPYAGLALYGAAKAAVIQFSKVLQPVVVPCLWSDEGVPTGSRSKRQSSGSAARTPRGAHIYRADADLHALSLIDDLSAEAIARMKAEGFDPAVVVETSPHNFQAWLNHGQVLDVEASMDMAWAKYGAECSLTLTQIQEELLNGGDLSKKGSRKRQLEYAGRTARRAIEQFG
jgi:NAD(P)-dependent dehydrogenase (short-subunit alcohol dehydrogenase family)